MKKHLIILIMLITLNSCVQHDPNIPTHKPEATFNISKAKVKERIMNRCVNKNLAVESVSDNLIICSATVEGTQGAFIQLAIGNSYSTVPVSKIRYLIFNSNGKVKVRADIWNEVTMAFGQVRKAQVNSQEANNKIYKILVELGGK